MNILSLFDGISCGQIALNRVGIKYNNYFASEIKKTAIGVTQHNYPNTIQIGNVINIHFKDGILYTEKGNFNVGRIDIL
jgi:site-specific DNA-cytosine methylase